MGCKRLLSSTVAVPYVLVAWWSVKQRQLKLRGGIFNSVDPIVALVGVVVGVLKKDVNTFYSRVLPQAFSCLIFTLEGCVRCQSSPCVMCGEPNCKETDFGPRISSVTYQFHSTKCVTLCDPSSRRWGVDPSGASVPQNYKCITGASPGYGGTLPHYTSVNFLTPIFNYS